MAILGYPTGASFYGGGGDYIVITKRSSIVSWYADEVSSQMNDASYNYNYIGIG